MSALQDLARLQTNIGKLHDIVHGAAGVTVATNSGPVPTIAGLQEELRALAASLTPTRASLQAQSVSATTAYVPEVDAHYDWIAGSNLPHDGWAVIQTTTGANGRWLLASEGLTMPATAAAADFNAAGVAVAALGRKMVLGPWTYTLAAQWSFPTQDALLVEMAPETVIVSAIGAPNPHVSPAHAVLYCAPGAQDRATTVSAVNTPGTSTIAIAAAVAVGEMIRVRNTGAGGFRGGRYMVRSVSGAGPYTVTVDRPILTQFAAGDEVYIWAGRRAFGHRIKGNGAIVRGDGTRMFEFICTEDCVTEDLRFEPTSIESVASYDTCGHRNLFRRIKIDTSRVPGGTPRPNNGLLLETNEDSAIEHCEIGGMVIDGIRLLNVEHCRVDADCYGNGVGIAVWGEGGDFLGSRHVNVRGRYHGNDTGVAIGVGSSHCDVDVFARHNAFGVIVGDASGGTSAHNRVGGDFSRSSTAAITIASQTKGTVLGVVDTSHSPTGINSGGGAAASWSARRHVHDGTVDAGSAVLLHTGGTAVIEEIAYDLVPSCSPVRVQNNGVIKVGSGTAIAGANSNMITLSGTAQAALDAVALIAAGSSRGVYAEAAGTSLRITDATNLAGCAVPISGDISVRGASRVLHRATTPAGLAANTIVQNLLQYTVPANALKTGMRLRITAAGALNNNPAAKTLWLYFGGVPLIQHALPVSTNAGWRLLADILITGPATQECSVQINAGVASNINASTAAAALTLDTTNVQAIQIQAQSGGGTLSDVVQRFLEVELLSL